MRVSAKKRDRRQNEIPYTMVKMADDGRRLPGYIVQCAKCGTTSTKIFNGGKVVPNDIVRNKFNVEGWDLGKGDDRSHDLCPVHANPEKETEDMAFKVSKNIPAPEPRQQRLSIVKEPQPEAAKPTVTIGKTERRIIFAKLNETYGEDSYSGDWTDAKVAADLGVPVEWVAEVRESGPFGPEHRKVTKEEVTALTNAVRGDLETMSTRLVELEQQRGAVVDKLRAINAELEAVNGEIVRLEERFNNLDRLLAGLTA